MLKVKNINTASCFKISDTAMNSSAAFCVYNIDKNKMSAEAILYPPVGNGSLMTVSEMKGDLMAKGITYGVDDAIIKECHALLEQMRELRKKAPHRTCFSKLYGAERELVKYIKASGNHYFDRIITDQKGIFEELKKDPQLKEETICFYEDNYPLDKLLGISSKLEKCFKKHVWLKSGGSLVIEPTEALTVIDVNTEKAVQGKRNKEHTFFKLNKEAAVEAARQMRLRNLSGIILIDFIDMEESAHVEELLKLLEQEMEKDRVPAKVIDMTALGLVEITRKKVRKPLYELLGKGKGGTYESLENLDSEER